MRVMYDVRHLGREYDPEDKQIRSGIFRAIEAVLERLIKRADNDISLYAGDYTPQCLRYKNAKPEFAALPIAASGRYARLNGAISQTTGPGNTLLKAQRRVLYEYHKALRTSPATVAGHALDAIDIFHATFDPVPEQIQQKKKLTKIITVYDIIPLLRPDYFLKGIDASLKYNIASVGGEGWIIAISESTKSDLCNHLGIRPERVFVTPLASEPTRFYPCDGEAAQRAVRNKYCLPDAPYLLTLSNLEPRKNIDHVLRCFARLINENQAGNINLVLAGGKAWGYDRIFEEIEKHSCLKGRVIVTGFVHDEDLAALYSGAQAFLYMSFYEGFGLPPLEAMQCGTPVITSNTSSLPEVVGDAGILLDPRDADGLCQAMLDMHNNATLRQEYSRAGLQRAALFSWERCAQQTLDAYKTALSQ